MSPKEIHDDFSKTLGDESPSYSTITKLTTKFGRGRKSVEDYKRFGRPREATTDKNVELVHSLIMCDRRRSPHGIARKIGINLGQFSLS